MEVREAIDSDAQKLSDFMNEISNENLSCLVPFDIQFTAGIQLGYIADFRKTKNAFLLLCVQDNKITGSLDLMPYSSIYKKHTARIGILVKKEARGTGVGSRLLKNLIELTRKTDLKKIEAELFSANNASLSLFLKSGFKIEGHKKQAYLIKDILYDVTIASYTI